MISGNLKYLRKTKGLSQEELAEKIEVTRQSIAKWESGETLPDLMKCRELALYFGTSIDHLMNYSFENESVTEHQKDGKYIFGIVKVGEKGQIVIPKGARTVFEIEPGDRLAVLGDTNQGGIALAKVPGLNIFNKKG